MGVNNKVDKIKLLDSKYSNFLKEEGKWLGGTLATVFKNRHYKEFKNEIFINIPVDIKEDLKHII
ncbi:hypothetical protein K7A41_00245 [Sphingobacterium sp. InxBP1]|uniref:hypothetical protein n=1 Tax=Sphingobacterium sp. InxBP1 TaxID=2870328 RepID=UPI0022431F36|nr:hypothetical protein [Sphingobacterium sp. InxBP1]MCW8309654.1 hypothetical protein [Sphingobacterium sp. InxBP1]